VGLKNMSLLTGATVAASAGTAIVFADTGTTIPNGVHLVVPATADYRVRQSSTWKFRAPRISSDGTYSRDSKSVSYNVPLILATGVIVNNVIRVEREVHPELSAAAALDLNKMLAQMLFDTDADNFWTAGSTT
jgi:hypothetical protein